MSEKNKIKKKQYHKPLVETLGSIPQLTELGSGVFDDSEGFEPTTLD